MGGMSMITDAVIIAIIMGLAETVKQIGFSKKFLPLFNIVLGVAAFFVWQGFDEWQTALFSGIVAGLTASGLYSGVKNVVQGVK
jgi:hypothetical protein